MYAESTKFVRTDGKNRDWWIVDAKGKVLGRLASRISHYLMGKHKPIWSHDADVGDFVVVINCKDVILTGRKLRQKIYYRHSQFPGGLKATSAFELLEKHPERLIKFAVNGMLPKNFTRKKIMKRLKVYPDVNHPHTAQKLKELKI